MTNSMIERRKFLIHPYYIMISLLLFAISALFLGCSIAYIYQRFQHGAPPIELPSLFYFNSIILLGSSFTLVMAKKKYLQDNTLQYKLYVAFTLVLSLLFLFMQILAWNELQRKNIFINYSSLSAYLYLISGLHFLHLVAGIPFLILFLRTAIVKMKSPVSVLIYFSDPEKERKLKLLSIYWHFMDGLWLYLVAFFAINYLFA